MNNSREEQLSIAHVEVFIYTARVGEAHISKQAQARSATETHRLVARSPHNRLQAASGRGRRRCCGGRREALAPATSTCRCRVHPLEKTNTRRVAAPAPEYVHIFPQYVGTGSRRRLFLLLCRAESAGRAAGSRRAAHTRS